MGIDESMTESFILREILAEHIQVDNNEADRQANLRCSQSDAVAGIKGFVHIINQHLEIWIIRCNIFSHFSQALRRGVAGLLAAIVLLAVSGFGVFRIARGAHEIAGTFDADPGTFVQHDIVFILDTFEDPAGGSAQYAVVPIGGQLVAFRFPARWNASVKTIADATTSVLSGQSYSVDSFIRVTGTVKAMPEAVSSEIYSWYTDNHDYLQKIGAIGDSDDAADYLPDAIVRVDYVGGIPQGWVEGLTVAAVACLIYAIVVFIRILCGKYDEQKLPDITFELVDMTPETPADPETTPEETPEAAAEPETAPEETPEAKPEAETPAKPETPAEPEKSDETEDTPDA